jgi:hypothetical protein
MQAQLVVFPSAARTATVTSQDYSLGHAGTGRLTFDVTVAPGVDTVTLSIQGKDVASGKYITLLASAAISATGTTQLTIGPTIPTAANAAVQTLFPETFRVVVTHSAGTSFTYSVGLEYEAR